MNSPHVIAKYRARFDRVYYREAMAKLRPIRHALRWFGVAFLVAAALLFVFMSAVAIADGDWGTVGLTAVPFVAFVVYLRLRAPPDLAKLRSAVDYRDETHIELTASGVELSGGEVTIELRWAAFRRAIVDSDGILLIHDDGSAVWLPDASRSLGERDEVEARIRAALPDVADSR